MLRVEPCTLRQANAFILQFHRHHGQVRGHRFSLAAWQGDYLVGVAVVGRPVARGIDPYRVCEVTRLASNGARNVCSFLYGRCAKIAALMGYARIQAYILAEESGCSLRAAGWTCDGVLRPHGRGWNNRPGRTSAQPTGPKIRWSRRLSMV